MRGLVSNPHFVVSDIVFLCLIILIGLATKTEELRPWWCWWSAWNWRSIHPDTIQHIPAFTQATFQSFVTSFTIRFTQKLCNSLSEMLFDLQKFRDLQLIVTLNHT